MFVNWSTVCYLEKYFKMYHWWKNWQYSFLLFGKELAKKSGIHREKDFVWYDWWTDNIGHAKVMYFTNYRPFANHYYERNNSCFCLFKNLFSLSFPICSQIYYFCKLIINRLSTIESHPLWVRGLKHHHRRTHTERKGRTPCGCVDWNRLAMSCFWAFSSSHPLWVRGLKLRRYNDGQFVKRSHPLWVRGLKHV